MHVNKGQWMKNIYLKTSEVKKCFLKVYMIISFYLVSEIQNITKRYLLDFLIN